jgi:hypothetical protein
MMLNLIKMMSILPSYLTHHHHTVDIVILLFLITSSFGKTLEMSKLEL